MTDRRNPGPINGKVGQLLAVVRQLTPLFGWVTVGFMLFGFQFTSPGQQISELNQRIAVVEEYVLALVRLRCDEVEDRVARLARLRCEEVR